MEGGTGNGWCGRVSVMLAGNPQAALLPAPLKGGDCLDGGRYGEWLVQWVVGAAVGWYGRHPAAQEMNCLLA